MIEQEPMATKHTFRCHVCYRKFRSFAAVAEHLRGQHGR